MVRSSIAGPVQKKNSHFFLSIINFFFVLFVFKLKPKQKFEIFLNVNQEVGFVLDALYENLLKISPEFDKIVEQRKKNGKLNLDYFWCNSVSTQDFVVNE